MGVLTDRLEFSQRLDKAADNLLALARDAHGDEELRIFGKRSAVEQALGLWISLTQGKGGPALVDAIAAFRLGIEANRKMEGLMPGESDGFGLVLSYLDESEFI